MVSLMFYLVERESSTFKCLRSHAIKGFSKYIDVTVVGGKNGKYTVQYFLL